MDRRYVAVLAFLAAQDYKNILEVIKSKLKGQKPAKATLKNGYQIEAPRITNDPRLFHLVYDIFDKKIYTPSKLEISSNDIVVDIGAHCGVFTVFAASLTRNTVYAFEPAPTNFEFLKRNIQANQLNNVILLNSAVSDKSGTTKFFLNTTFDQGNQLSHPDSYELELFEFDEIEVQATTLKDFMEDYHLEQIDFLKMDCQGAEGAILLSTPQEYFHKIGKIAMEFHEQSQINYKEIQKLLEERGFITRLIWDNASPTGLIYAWKT